MKESESELSKIKESLEKWYERSPYMSNVLGTMLDQLSTLRWQNKEISKQLGVLDARLTRLEEK